MKKIFIFVTILLYVAILYGQTSYIEFTYNASGNRTGRAIVMEKPNETDSVVNDTNALVQGEMLKQDETLKQVQGDVVQGDVQDDVMQDNVLQQPLINETLALEAETLQMQIFPNPTYGRLNINLSGTLPEQALQLSVTNVGGSMLFTQDLLFSSNTLNLSHLPAGVYYINVIAGGKKLKEYKIVKL